MDKGKEIIAKLKVLFGSALSDEDKAFLKTHVTKLTGEIAAPAVTLGTAKTKDGKALSYDGELKEGTALSVVDPASGPAPAPDGTHELEDGTKITTSAGLVTKVEKVAPAPPIDMAAVAQTLSAQFSAQKTEIEAKFSAVVEGYKSEIKGLKEAQIKMASMVEKILNTPFDTIALSKQKTYEEMTPAERYAIDHPIENK